MTTTRTERDSLGTVEVPTDALFGAQTQRARDNFAIAGRPLPTAFIRGLCLIKREAAAVNAELGTFSSAIGAAIQSAADEVLGGQHAAQFPIDVFQTGSGTSTNMNANEVLAHRASALAQQPIHPERSRSMPGQS